MLYTLPEPPITAHNAANTQNHTIDAGSSPQSRDDIPIRNSPKCAFFIAPDGATAHPAGRCEHISFQSVKSLVFSARKGA